MKVAMSVVIGVWSAFWVACSVSAWANGDGMGVVAFAVLAGIPWLWFAELTGTKRGTTDKGTEGTEYTGT
jgi:hypothetical protein